MPTTDRDRALLRFAAEHRTVLAAHVQTLFGVSASAAQARLRTLVDGGLLHRHPVPERPGRCYSITRRGLDTVESDLPVPRLDPRGFRHDAGLAWLWLAASAGGLGPVGGLVSERRMRSADAAEAHAARAADSGTEPFAVRLGGIGPGGRERLHYPDLLLLGRGGGRLAVELELTAKARTRRELILAGYGADRRIDGVLYVVERRALGRGIERTAERLGVRGRVRVQFARWGAQGPARGAHGGLERDPGRRRTPVREAGR